MNTRKMLVALAVVVGVGAAGRSLAAPEPRTIEIAVTEKGFEPNRIQVVKGQPLRLVVTRKTDHTCAKEIVIPDANIRTNLPLNKPMTLTFTPSKDGDLSYACAMNMVGGVIHVVSRDGVGATTPEHQAGATVDRQSGIASGQRGMMGGQGMMGDQGGMIGGGMQDMRAIHGLLSQHDKIHRIVDDIPNGVETVTMSDDDQVAKLIREHTWQMKARIEEGRPIHQMDPLFREIFKNHDHIHMKIVDIPGGVRVTETADTPNVVLLVRQHARRAVSEFVAQGMPRMMQPTPLPPGYVPSDEQGQAQARHGHGCRCMGST